MSSLRNVVHRRPHKERSQPKERSKWGLLEKHKDYSLRAKDYNEKKAKLKILRQKASERNADEFHFAMMSHRFEDGSKRKKKSEFADMEHAKSQLLKTQDAGYLRTMIQSTRHARERLEEDVALQRAQKHLHGSIVEAGDGRTSGVADRHVVFVDDLGEQLAYKASSLEVTPHTSENKTQKDADAMSYKEDKLDMDINVGQSTETFLEELDQGLSQERTIKAQQRKLDALRLREKALVEAELELELQRARMSNSLGGVTKAGHRFKIKARKK